MENSAARPDVKETMQGIAYVAGGVGGLGVSSTLYSTEKNLSLKKSAQSSTLYTYVAALSKTEK